MFNYSFKKLNYMMTQMIEWRLFIRFSEFTLEVRLLQTSSSGCGPAKSGRLLHHQVQPLEGFHHFIEALYVGVSQLDHAGNLGGDKGPRSLIQTLLIQDFYCNSFYQLRTGQQ